MTQLVIHANDTPVGSLAISVVVRDTADIQTFGGPPIVYDVHPTSAPPEFHTDGNPYGGWLRVAPDGAKVGGRLYRAGCFGPPAAEVELLVCVAVVAAMEPHLEAVAESARKQQRALIVAAIRRWEATTQRLRGEARAAEAAELAARQLLREQFGETLDAL